jgi:putative membrane protein
MKIRTLAGLLSLPCALALGTAQARAQSTAPPKTAPAEADAAFVREAATASMTEVELGRLALQKATRPEVKSYAQMLVEDHGKANEELQSLASRKQLRVPDQPKSYQKAEKARLEKLSGAAFDDAFVKSMAADHEKAVSLFSKQASSGADADLKDWAQKTLPTLKQHLAKAQELARGKSANATTDR